ncbi:thiamine biosynthesis lipoprotein [Shimia gijangensis]|uniref:FAD:protein FMN transferase n=1 Tax=Shimia gijangensis TaxID=1470563 RepID=A0A1M6LQ35_9RHOB|nr:FAD:protein FMN transferase [Shimia gijangensis]SHJ73313.1 thiamine biosynthesis lipoprotein [Shimia gijangensis]
MSDLSRRRFLTIAAASAALPAMAATPTVAHWNGRAMGARVSMKLAGIDATTAAQIFTAVEQELMRLEGIFSLYRTDSEVTRLNLNGALRNPSHELLQVLSLCDRLNRASNGAFDPTIQPLWLAVAQGHSAAAIEQARALVDWTALRFDASEVRFDGAGRGLTLNGVAQGFVTDKIASLLKSHGLRDVLVDMGEIAALGHDTDGSNWSAGVEDTDGTVVHRLELSDRALATSAPMGTRIGADSGQGHIFAASPTQAPLRRVVSVSASNAALADGLSTTLCMFAMEDARIMIESFPGAQLEFSA